MARLSIQDIAKAVADKHGLSKADAEAFVSAFFDTINEGLNHDKAVKIKGLGTFKVIDVKGRESVNVNTGERVMIEGHGKITFTPDTIMRDLVNKPFAQFETVVINDGVDIDALNDIDADENLTESIEEGDETPQEEEVIEEKIEVSTTPTIEEEPAAEQEEADQTTEIVPQETPEQEVKVEEAEPTEVIDIETATENVATEEAEVINEQAESAEPQEEDEVTEEPERHRSFIKPLLTTLLVVIVAAAALISGFYWGRGTNTLITEKAKPHPTSKPAKQVVKVDTTATKDTASAQPKEPVIKPDPADETEEVKPKQTEKAVERDITEPSPNDDLAMRNAKAIVRTGAYRIVGTSKTLTVKKGDSMKKLAKTYLGESMECYIQVHNGVSEIKEGMTLNIPKLELKKKKHNRK